VTIQDGPSQKTVPHGHRLLVNIVAASRDPDVFPDPLSIKLDRPMDKYIHYGHGPHQCAGLEASQVALGTLFKKVMALKGLRRVKGEGGRLKKVPAPHGYTVYMQSDWSGFFGVPVTMRVEWDGDGKF
jgi:linoleate 10R-lipoxygenase